MKKYLFASLMILVLCISGCQPASPLASQAVAPTPTDPSRLESIEPFQDVRNKDLSGLTGPLDESLIATLWFNQSTQWPEQSQALAQEILERGKNPGLGIRKLHQQGITGKGVTVAIIDQNLVTDHPEFAGKIIKYKDVGTNQPADESSMHGPAVASLLVGETIGTAPGARLYYAAAPSWKLDAQYFADALSWIIEENASLPAGEKIRLVSVSANPSGPGSPFKQNNAAWDSAYQRAADAGILVLDCTSNKGLTAPCYVDPLDPENVTKCTPGWPTKEPFLHDEQRIYIPSAMRTTVEEYYRGNYSYQYDAQGGLSWSVPYVAGVLAMGWQLRPDLTYTQMLDLLFASASLTEEHLKIIDPEAFIEMVKQASFETWEATGSKSRALLEFSF